MTLKTLVNQFALIFRHAKPGRAAAGIFLLVLILAQAIAELALTGTVSLLGVAMASPESLARFGWFQHLLDLSPLVKQHASQPAGMLTIVLLLVVIGSILKNLLTALTTYSQTRYGQAIAADLGRSLFNAYLNSPYLWHLSQNTAELSSILNFRAFTAQYVASAIRLATQLTIGTSLLLGALFLATEAAAIVIGASSLCAIFIYRFARSRVGALAKNGVRLNKGAAKIGMAALQGIREVLIYRQQSAFITQYSQNIEELGRNQAKAQTLSPLPTWVLEPVGVCTLLFALLYMISVGTPIDRLTGSLTLLAAMAWRLLPCMNKTVTELISLHSQCHYVDTFLQRLKEMPQTTPLEEQRHLPFRDSLRMSGVSFRYPNAQTDALQEIELTIPQGKMIGIVGPSGAGKSTLIGILTGLLEPTAGLLLVDGSPVDEEQLGQWSRNIGYVPQSPYLLDAGLAENVAFSQWGKPIDRSLVRRCCDMAAMDFLDQLPAGMDTCIGERGVRLSGGQMQRVAIARALYCQPELIVFDEATSALDSATEDAIQKTILTLKESMTMVIIAHRLSTVEQCDTVYWLESGRIKAAGHPSEVLPSYRAALKAAERPPTQTQELAN